MEQGNRSITHHFSIPQCYLTLWWTCWHHLWVRTWWALMEGYLPTYQLPVCLILHYQPTTHYLVCIIMWIIHMFCILYSQDSRTTSWKKSITKIKTLSGPPKTFLFFSINTLKWKLEHSLDKSKAYSDIVIIFCNKRSQQRWVHTERSIDITTDVITAIFQICRWKRWEPYKSKSCRYNKHD